jgi:alpha-tubulin suppressor-like RCC1 family protein
VAISAGGLHSLFIKAGGALWGMGDNAYYQLGLGGGAAATPVPIATGVGACSAGGAHSFWISGGRLYATGNNDHGQLGTGTTFTRPSSPSYSVIATGVASVSTAYNHTLFTKADGSLWAMGANSAGQLGDGTATARLSPVQVATGVAKIATGGLLGGLGGGHSLFAKTDGTLWATGDNSFGQLGDGTRQTRFAPVPVSGASYVTAVAAGDIAGAFVQSNPVAPAITIPPAARTVPYGSSARLDVSATGGFLSYQWFLGPSGDTSQPVPGATSATVLTRPVVTPLAYWVRVTNPIGSVDSPAATITPEAPLGAALSATGLRTAGEHGESLAPFSPSIPTSAGTDLVSVAASNDHALILKSDASLWATGLDSYGALGTGSTTLCSAPIQIATSVASISVGVDHSLFLKTDGTLWSMGLNSSGQLGDGKTVSSSTPIQIATDVSAIAAGGFHSLFLKTDGSLWAAGANTSGQLGDGTTTSKSTPIQIATSVASFSAGRSHSLFLKSDGSLWGMGLNSSGQLGDGTTTSRSTPVLIASDVADVSTHATGNHTLFLKTNGTLWAAGSNANGQLGSGDTTNRSSPVLLASDVLSCSAGSTHSLFVRKDRTLWTVGGNAHGQLGLGTYAGALLPQEIATHVDHASATAYGSLFVTQTGDTRVMGLNRFGLLGVTLSPPSRSTPTLLSLSVSEADATPGSSLHRSGSGSLWSSEGLPLDGSPAPGVIDTGAVRLVPAPLLKPPGLDGALSSVVTRTHFLRADGSLWGAGENFAGALGTGDILPRSTPVHIADDVSDAGAIWSFTLFLKPDLSLWKVGGIVAPTPVINTAPEDRVPSRIDEHVVALATSYRHALYLKADGSVWGLGDSQNGQLGFTLIGSQATTAPVQIFTQVAAIAVSARHSLLLKTDGSLWGCGFNSYGQLGPAIGTTRPVAQFASEVAAIAASPEASYFIKTDGSLWACGNNQFGQLGAGSSTSISTPIQVATAVAEIIPSATGENAFFRKTDGSLWGMGRNDLGQLGLGHTSHVRTPVRIRTQAYAVAASGLHTLVLHEPPAPLTAPAIVTQPVSQTATFGDFASLTVSASGDGILAYQWFEGPSGDTSRPVAGADYSTLRFPAFAGTASYWVRVANAAGSADSAAATITVQGAGSPSFRAWAEAAGLAGSRLSVSADADSDGLANLLEYAFGTPPDATTPSAAPSPELVSLPEGDFLVLTHRRRKASDASIAYERSADLQTWAPASLAPVVVDPDADGDGLVEEVSVALPLPPGSPRDFLRVTVSSP